MVTRRQIRKFVDAVVERFDPHRVILFGSYAYGTPTEDSDVDLLVVMPHPGRTTHAAAIAIRLNCDRDFAMDLLVRSPAEVAKRLAIGDCFMHEVTSKGVQLYERHHGTMACESGERLRRRRRTSQSSTKVDA